MDEQLRALQLFELNILKKVTEICDRNNLTYYLCSGTLLGAVRHQGFIPWDDDIDIAMPYSDYKRFISIGQEELGDNYFLQSCETDLYFHRAYTRIRANNTTMLDPYHSKSHTHQGIWIDIFPLVYFDSRVELKCKQLLIKISNFLQMDDWIATSVEEFKERMGKPGIVFIKCFYSVLPIRLRQRIHILFLDWLGRKKNGIYIAEVWGNITHYYSSKLLDGEKSKVLFEGDYFYTFPNYRHFLKRKYGDYMELPPEDQRKGHGSNMIIDLENDYSKYMSEK